jgi:hypothetical protein
MVTQSTLGTSTSRSPLVDTRLALSNQASIRLIACDDVLGGAWMRGCVTTP